VIFFRNGLDAAGNRLNDVDEYCGDALGNSLYHASFEIVFQQMD